MFLVKAIINSFGESNDIIILYWEMMLLVLGMVNLNWEISCHCILHVCSALQVAMLLFFAYYIQIILIIFVLNPCNTWTIFFTSVARGCCQWYLNEVIDGTFGVLA